MNTRSHLIFYKVEVFEKSQKFEEIFLKCAENVILEELKLALATNFESFSFNFQVKKIRSKKYKSLLLSFEALSLLI